MPDTAPDHRPGSEDLGAFLVEQGKLDKAALDRARRICRETGNRFSSILTNLGLVSERDLAQAFSDFLGIRLATLDDYPGEPVGGGRMSSQFLKEFRVLPLADGPEGLDLAMVDPLDDYAIQAVSLKFARPVRPLVGIPEEVDAAYERLYAGSSASIEEIVADDPTRLAEENLSDIERLKDLASGAPVIRLVNQLITRAVEMRASDVHIEPFEASLRVRYRIDGVLRDIAPPPSSLRQAVVSRVKIMAKLDIAESRLPQDGRIRLTIRGNEIDLRVSTVPAMHGESVVLRVLDRSAVALDFPALGFEGQELERYLAVLERPHGIVLVTGPTGSGKTTTLYASLTHLNTGTQKILTVEDPIEFQLEGVNQVQVHPQIGLNFARALRAFLRQDPDIIMIGEIRDLETVEIAVQAALTGHLVLSTVHTNDAASTIARLLDMGVEDYLLASTVSGITAQRLARTLCAECREPYRPLAEMAEQLALAADPDGRPPLLHRARGCDACNGTGYRGRTCLLETLAMSEGLQQLVLRRATAQEIHKTALGEGMRSLYQDGLAKARAGVTSIDEVLRVTRQA